MDCRLSSISPVSKTFFHVLITVSISTAFWVTDSNLPVKMNRLVFWKSGSPQIRRRKTRARHSFSQVSEQKWLSLPMKLHNAQWSFYGRFSQPVAHDPFGVKWEFHSGHISDIYTVIHNNSKLQLWNSNENDFMVSGHHNLENCIKRLQP